MNSLVSVNTYAHSVAYVTDQMLSSLELIIKSIGLDPKKFVNDWEVYEVGIKIWLNSHHLKNLILEVTSSSGAFVTRCDFTIDYSYGDGEGSMWIDTNAIKFAIAKFGTIPAYCNYSVIVETHTGRPDVPGFVATTVLSTIGFVRQSLGTAIGTNYLGAQASYFRKL